MGNKCSVIIFAIIDVEAGLLLDAGTGEGGD